MPVARVTSRTLPLSPRIEQLPALVRYGFHRTGYGSACDHCGAEFSRATADGAVMRSHARRCPVAPRDFHTPGVCDA